MKTTCVPRSESEVRALKHPRGVCLLFFYEIIGGNRGINNEKFVSPFGDVFKFYFARRIYFDGVFKDDLLSFRVRVARPAADAIVFGRYNSRGFRAAILSAVARA